MMQFPSKIVDKHAYIQRIYESMAIATKGFQPLQNVKYSREQVMA